MVVCVSVRGVRIQSFPQVGARVIEMHGCVLISGLKVLPENMYGKIYFEQPSTKTCRKVFVVVIPREGRNLEVLSP